MTREISNHETRKKFLAKARTRTFPEKKEKCGFSKRSYFLMYLLLKSMQINVLKSIEEVIAFIGLGLGFSYVSSKSELN